MTANTHRKKGARALTPDDFRPWAKRAAAGPRTEEDDIAELVRLGAKQERPDGE